MPTKRLLPLESFAPIFEPFRGQKVTLTEGVGWNPGDLVLYRATEQLCEAFGVRWEKDLFETEHCLLFAGGNMFGPYGEEIKIRLRYIQEALYRKMSLTLLPQSFFPKRTATSGRAPISDCIAHVGTIYVREQESLRIRPDAGLMPDLALGYQFPDYQPEEEPKEVSHILRRDVEGLVCQILGVKSGDPVKMKKPQSLLAAANSGLHVYTDRLHVAIAALAYGRQVTLIGNAYHKNKSMWETWLRDLGCEFLKPREYCNIFSKAEVL